MVYFILAWLFIRETKKYTKLDYEIKEISLRPYRVLVVFVSEPNKDTQSERFFSNLYNLDARKALIQDLNFRANWIMPLILFHEFSKLKSV